MNRVTAILTGAGLGALTMYAFDLDAGRRRKALARDQATRLQIFGSSSLVDRNRGP